MQCEAGNRPHETMAATFKNANGWPVGWFEGALARNSFAIVLQIGMCRELARLRSGQKRAVIEKLVFDLRV